MLNAIKLNTNHMHPYVTFVWCAKETLTTLQDLANCPTRGVVLPKHSHLEVCMTWWFIIFLARFIETIKTTVEYWSYIWTSLSRLLMLGGKVPPMLYLDKDLSWLTNEFRGYELIVWSWKKWECNHHRLDPFSVPT